MLKPKVLIVEDYPMVQHAYERAFEGRADLLQAFTIDQAREMLLANSDIALIVMDGCVSGPETNTPPFVREVRKTFTGPILAASNSEGAIKELMAAGCSHQVASKVDVPDKVLSLLGI